MILCVDCGNTRLKWGVRDGDGWVARGSLGNEDLGRLPGEVDAVVGDSRAVALRRLLACSVAGRVAATAVEGLAASLGLATDWVVAGAERCGVRNGYERPSQLGADRWAALIGARALRAGPCLVVCAGTATTVDVLQADGLFPGGLILPGLELMRRALARETAGLPLAAGALVPLPRNTDDAIASGCLQATLGAVERMFRPLAAGPGGEGALCLLSGGAAALLAPHLAVPHRVVDDLVLEGLAEIARRD
ncbi:MAG TPA: type III pantothenate kinase [Rhodocyclaceae bacterium]|nr:type III pantothenate kinase [Rhodocyclaceae bacterium]HNH35530.1 type III pantothenate kinase [Rhodocyclaceae bacterium]